MRAQPAGRSHHQPALAAQSTYLLVIDASALLKSEMKQHAVSAVDHLFLYITDIHSTH
jgi:hypothetical protein